MNEEIQSGKIQNYTYYFEFSCSGFPHWEYKRAGISKIFAVILYPIFIHMYPNWPQSEPLFYLHFLLAFNSCSVKKLTRHALFQSLDSFAHLCINAFILINPSNFVMD